MSKGDWQKTWNPVTKLHPKLRVEMNRQMHSYKKCIEMTQNMNMKNEHGTDISFVATVTGVLGIFVLPEFWPVVSAIVATFSAIYFVLYRYMVYEHYKWEKAFLLDMFATAVATAWLRARKEFKQ